MGIFISLDQLPSPGVTINDINPPLGNRSFGDKRCKYLVCDVFFDEML